MRLLAVAITCGVMTCGPVLGSAFMSAPRDGHAEFRISQGAPLATSRRTINLTEQDRHTIRELVLKDPKVKPESGGTGEIGEIVPPEVMIHEFPPLLGDKIAALKAYRYFISEDSVMIVETSERRIADIVKASDNR